MAEHKATVAWQLSGPDFLRQQYSRAHTWTFDGGAVVPASSSPANVALPWSDPAGVDPEEALVAAVSSCHMLWWLSLAAQAGFAVESYRDEAVGQMTRDERGVWWISLVTLRPRIAYHGRAPTPAEETALHEAAHERCFIAHSIKARVVVDAPRP